MAEKQKVAFICINSSCRLQMAEAVGKKVAFDVLDAWEIETLKKG